MTAQEQPTSGRGERVESGPGSLCWVVEVAAEDEVYGPFDGRSAVQFAKSTGGVVRRLFSPEE
jgi:hypothetical protein